VSAAWLEEFKALSDIDCQLPTLPTLPTSQPPPHVGNFDNVGKWHRDPAGDDFDPFADLPPNDPAYQGEWQRWFNLLVQHKHEIGNLPTHLPDGTTRPSSRDLAEAHVLALGEAENLWHSRYGRRPDPHSCAGCGRPIGQSTPLALSDGAKIRDDSDFICLTAYGIRWRTAATDAFRLLGVCG
jgi:hypothetical protein